MGQAAAGIEDEAYAVLMTADAGRAAPKCSDHVVHRRKIPTSTAQSTHFYPRKSAFPTKIFPAAHPFFIILRLLFQSILSQAKPLARGPSCRRIARCAHKRAGEIPRKSHQAKNF